MLPFPQQVRHHSNGGDDRPRDIQTRGTRELLPTENGGKCDLWTTTRPWAL